MRAASLLLALLAFGLGLHVLLFGHPQCFFFAVGSGQNRQMGLGIGVWF